MGKSRNQEIKIIKHMISLREVRDWIDTLPKEFLEFNVVNAEEGTIVNDEVMYRFDKPISSLNVDGESKKILFLNKKTNKK